MAGLRVNREGKFVTKQALVLLPGLVCDDAIWINQVRHLDEIADMTIPPLVESDEISAQARHVLENTPENFALAGFSMGGYVALEMLRQAPERITRLALLDTTSRLDTPEKTAGRQQAIQRCEDGRFQDVIRDMLAVLLHPSRQTSPLADFVTGMADRVGSDCFVRRHKTIMSRQSCVESLQSCKVPVRVICGRQDAMTSVEEHKELAALVPDARLSIIEECGHMTPIETPHATSALLRDWLLYN